MNDRPAWGPGRDDAFNLPKFILTQSPWDHSVGNTDFPAVWGMAAAAASCCIGAAKPRRSMP